MVSTATKRDVMLKRMWLPVPTVDESIASKKKNPLCCTSTQSNDVQITRSVECNDLYEGKYFLLFLKNIFTMHIRQRKGFHRGITYLDSLHSQGCWLLQQYIIVCSDHPWTRGWSFPKVSASAPAGNVKYSGEVEAPNPQWLYRVSWVCL